MSSQSGTDSALITAQALAVMPPRTKPAYPEGSRVLPTCGNWKNRPAIVARIDSGFGGPSYFRYRLLFDEPPLSSQIGQTYSYGAHELRPADE